MNNLFIEAHLVREGDEIAVDGRKMTVGTVENHDGFLSISGFVSGMGYNFFFCLPNEGIELVKGV